MNECYGINRIPVIILWKLFFFSGQKSQKKNWVKIFCDTHTSHLYLSEVRYLWFIVIYRELLWMSSLYFLVNTCGFLWFQRGQMSLAKSKNTRKHKKPQVFRPLENRLNRAKYFLVVFLRGLRGLSVSVKSTFLQYCELMWFLVKIILVFLVDSEVILVISCGRIIHSVQIYLTSTSEISEFFILQTYWKMLGFQR